MDPMARLPAALKYDILDFVAPKARTQPAGSAARTATPAEKLPRETPIPCPPSVELAALLATLLRDGCVTVNSLLGKDAARAMHDAVAARYTDHPDLFHRAGVGRGPLEHRDTAARGDEIMWVEDSDGADRSVPALRPLLDWADGLRAALQRAWAPGITLTRRSVQVARYSGAGVGYVRHRDTPADLPDDRERRLVTIVMYLNDGWDAAHGGVLRVYSPDAPTGSGIRDVPPMMGTAVVFLSYLEHEVLPVYRERFAVTVWLYGTGPLFHPLIRTPAPGRNLTPVIPAAARFATTFESNRRIFVSIASYRDVECQQTIRSLFAKAAHPDRVFLGVVHQLKLPDDAPVVPGPHPYPDQVREMRLPHSMATGPCLARHLAQSLYNGERYYLQIDAHMRLTRGWDDKLVRWLEDLRAAGTERPVLTTYPPDYSPGPTTGPCDVGALPDDVDGVDAVPTILCAKGFVSGSLPNQNQNPDEDSGPLLRLQSRSLLRRPTSPVPSLFCAAGFLFTTARVLWEVPYDPNLEYVFFGEESSMIVRLWTSGYDFFAPPKTVAYHLWSRAYRPSFWENVPDGWKERRNRAMRRVSAVLSTPAPEEDLGGYGIGTVRTLEEYQVFSGVDFTSHTLSPRALCGGVEADE